MFFLFALINSINCYNFDLSNVQVLTTKSNIYFGYSLLLQKGDPSYLIVGAPKSEQTGAIYRCDLNNKNYCYKYNLRKSFGIYYNKSGDLLGAALDGEDFAGGMIITCAPRFIVNYDANNYFMNGKCYKITNSTNIYGTNYDFSPLKSYKQVNTFDKLTYYDAAFGQAGFDLKYSQEDKELLIGVPGMVQWNGALLRIDLHYGEHDLLPTTTKLANNSPHNTYLGYSVSSGKFLQNSSKIWYLAGAPRGAGLKGLVMLFEKSFTPEKIAVKAEFFGQEFGSYFGATLLVVNRDFLVGAPMFSGQTWDEGCVYFYKNRDDGNFLAPVQLFIGKSGGRFGSALSLLGDIDLDSYLDIAISAPGEDDGVGAVYIYMGNENGFRNKFSQKISPLSFKHPLQYIAGFGLGLSRGNDIDNNSHNDLIIGAYQSNAVFIFKTLPIIDYNLVIIPKEKSLNTTSSEIKIRFCGQFRARNSKILVVQSKFLVTFDKRATNLRNFTEEISLKHNQLTCTEKAVLLDPSVLNLDPFTITLGCEVAEKTVISSEIGNRVTEQIPFSSGCGVDNICQTDLSLEIVSNLSHVVLGMDKELDITVTISNKGEPAYHTELFLTIPESVNVINVRECTFNNNSYACLIDEMLVLQKTKQFRLDVSQVGPESNLIFKFEATSLGSDLNPENNKILQETPVVLFNNPFIEEQSNPDNIVLEAAKAQDKVVFMHHFSVGNLGPSPVDLNVNLLIPKVEGSVFEVNYVEGKIDSYLVECFEKKTENLEISRNFANKLRNRTIFVGCFQKNDCLYYFCRGGYMPKSSKTAIFSVKITANLPLVTRKFENELTDKDIIAFVTTAVLRNSTNVIQTFSVTNLYGFSVTKAVPLWIYVVSIISGLGLLALLVLVLYKCNFFRRSYKVRLQNEECVELENSDSTLTEELQ